MAKPPFLVRIWGARGSLPAPAGSNCEFGSDTCCVEVRCGSDVLIFDAGTGAAGLGTRLAQEAVKSFDLFFSHCHFDHIIGFPFIKPLFDPSATIRVYAGHFEDATTCRAMAERFLSPPFFPLTPAEFRARIEYVDFRPPDQLTPRPGISVGTVRLNHPNGAVGYRIDFAGRSLCYVTDTEHLPGRLDEALVSAIQGSDMLIYDCMYTEAEFSPCRGYGHSTWQEGVRLCEAAGVGRLVLFHHRPGRDDAGLLQIETEAQARFPGAIVARTGLELTL